MTALPEDGLVAIVKRDCPTCVLTAPVLGELARRAGITVYSQDDPGFPDTVPGPQSDLGLDLSHRLKIEIVPTLIRLENGREVLAPSTTTKVRSRSAWLRPAHQGRTSRSIASSRARAASAASASMAGASSRISRCSCPWLGRPCA